MWDLVCRSADEDSEFYQNREESARGTFFRLFGDKFGCSGDGVQMFRDNFSRSGGGFYILPDGEFVPGMRSPRFRFVSHAGQRDFIALLDRLASLNAHFLIDRGQADSEDEGPILQLVLFTCDGEG